MADRCGLVQRRLNLEQCRDLPSGNVLLLSPAEEKGPVMLQLVYISTAVKNPSCAEILRTSRRNNGRDRITGLLYADGVRFMQALEGPDEVVEAAYQRIKADPRHKAAVILSRREVDAREFGDWEMAERRPGNDADTFIERIGKLTAGASPSVRATFDGFLRVKRWA